MKKDALRRVVALALWGMVVLLGGMCNGCDGCGGTASAPTDVVDSDLGPPPEEVVVPGDNYKDAFAAAKKDFDIDSARARLREIERDVVREREELR